MHEDFSASLTVSTDSGRERRRRFILAAIVVVRWSRDLDATFILFKVLYTSDELLYSLRSILIIAETDVSKHISVLDTFV